MSGIAIVPIDDLEKKTQLLDRLAEAAGRDPQAIARTSSISIEDDWGDVRRNIDGLSRLNIWWPEQGTDRVREFAETVMPDFLSPQGAST